MFHRADGSQIKDMRKPFKAACEKAGVTGKVFHDFRRTAVRSLERAGVARSSAMAMVGHETESIYKGCAIQDETMLREAAAKLDAWTAEQQAMNQVRGFAKDCRGRGSNPHALTGTGF